MHCLHSFDICNHRKSSVHTCCLPINFVHSAMADLINPAPQVFDRKTLERNDVSCANLYDDSFMP